MLTLGLSHLPGKLLRGQMGRPYFSAVGKDYCAFDQYRPKIASEVTAVVIFLHSLCKN